MRKRILLINWKFLDDNDKWEFNGQKGKLFNILNSSEDLIFACNYSRNEEKEFLNYLEDIFLKFNDDNILILLHKDNGINKIELKKLKYFEIYKFGGGANDGHPIYYDSNLYPKGLLGGSKFEDSIFSDNSENIKSDNFNFVWDEYWNKVDLKNQKKKLITLWLPLAIDTQGLSEVKDDEGKARKYFEDIKKEENYLISFESFLKDEEFPRWKEIKNELGNDEKTKPYADFNPTTLVDELKKDSSNFNSFKSNTAQYLEKEIDNRPNPNFLPNWLQEVVSILDKKINAESSENSK